MQNKLAELSVLAIASKYGLLKQNQQGKVAKTKKQIKARAAAKRQRKARKNHAYKSVFRDKAKVVKKKPSDISPTKQLSKQGINSCPPYFFASATKNKAYEDGKNIWQQAYESITKKTNQDIINSSCIDNGLAGSLSFDSSGKIILVDKAK